jgi:hypothetical protein
MRRLTFVLHLAVASLITLGATPPAHADAADPDATRIASAGHGLKWNWTPPWASARYGHAETLIHAALPTVRRAVLDFSHYKELATSISTSRVVGHWPDGSTDVYIRMGVLNNTITFWNVTRFAPLRVRPDGCEVVEGHMVQGKGNIDDSATVWTLHSAGPEWTVLKFDVLLNPGMPAPQSLIDEQLRDSAMDAVNAIQSRAQGTHDVLPYPG